MAAWRISSRLVNVALLGLLALDVTLVGTALKSTHATGIDTSPVSSAASSIDPTGVPESSSPSSSSSAVNAPLQTMLVALDDQRAWRVGAGSCSAGGATLATTTDGGKTWVKGNAGLSRIVRVRPQDNQVAFVIGADTTCSAQLKGTSDGGSTFGSGGS